VATPLLPQPSSPSPESCLSCSSETPRTSEISSSADNKKNRSRLHKRQTNFLEAVKVDQARKHSPSMITLPDQAVHEWWDMERLLEKEYAVRMVAVAVVVIPCA